jgi:hypothetical protein
VDEGSYTGVDAILLRCECRSLRDLAREAIECDELMGVERERVTGEAGLASLRASAVALLARFRPATPTSPPRCAAGWMLGLTEEWECALNARREMSPRSPVAALDALLWERP